MNSHHARFVGIAMLTAVLFVGEIVLMAMGRFESMESVALSSSLAILLPALVDAGAVEKRRRTPGEQAVKDDEPDDKDDKEDDNG